MKNNLRLLAGVALGAAALILSSCAYDPYYSSSTTVSGSYSSGYRGGSSTSLYISTGDPRWGYDPYTYCYYDYHRRAYYDPYLYGYYPVGYRPAVVYGAPHPYGWRQGATYIRPPSRVTNVTVVNYRNREAAYRNTNYGWAKQVRGTQAPQGIKPSKNSYRESSSGYRESSSGYRESSRPSIQQGNDRPTHSRPSFQQNTKPQSREIQSRPSGNRVVNHKESNRYQEPREARGSHASRPSREPRGGHQTEQRAGKNKESQSGRRF